MVRQVGGMNYVGGARGKRGVSGGVGYVKHKVDGEHRSRDRLGAWKAEFVEVVPASAGQCDNQAATAQPGGRLTRGRWPHEMSTEFAIQRAAASDAPEVAVMVGELLAEIMVAIGIQVFNFDLAETQPGSRTSSIERNISSSSPWKKG